MGCRASALRLEDPYQGIAILRVRMGARCITRVSASSASSGPPLDPMRYTAVWVPHAYSEAVLPIRTMVFDRANVYPGLMADDRLARNQPGGPVVNARETGRSGNQPVRRGALLTEFHSVDAHMVNAHSERVLKTLILAVCAWSLIEAPLELDMSDAYRACWPCSCRSSWWSAQASLPLPKYVSLAKCSPLSAVRACWLSHPGLPMEFKQSFAIAMISTVECFTKAACVLAFGVLSSRAKQSRQQ